MNGGERGQGPRGDGNVEQTMEWADRGDPELDARQQRRHAVLQRREAPRHGSPRGLSPEHDAEIARGFDDADRDHDADIRCRDDAGQELLRSRTYALDARDRGAVRGRRIPEGPRAVPASFG